MKSKMTNINSIKFFALGFAGVALAACNTASTTPGDALGLDKKENEVDRADVPDQSQNLRAFCPKTIIRAGTETHRTFANGVTKDDPDALNSLNFQSTITEVARECNYTPTNLNMRVGIKGRVINGPTGQTGTLNVPVRVAVANTANEVVYSVLHQVPVTIPEGGANAKFSYVDSDINIPVPERNNLIVYVGFDEGPPS